MDNSRIDPTDFEHVRVQRDRDLRDATVYSLEVYEADDGAYVATQQDGELEALGCSHAEAIANYARAIDTRSEAPSPEVPADD